jgi:hypothetical protein
LSGRLRGATNPGFFEVDRDAVERKTSYNMRMTRPDIVERKGKLEDLDRSFDLSFWQAQSPAVRFNATWELIVHYAKVKGLDVRQLRLQRSIETFQRQRR